MQQVFSEASFSLEVMRALAEVAGVVLDPAGHLLEGEQDGRIDEAGQAQEAQLQAEGRQLLTGPQTQSGPCCLHQAVLSRPQPFKQSNRTLGRGGGGGGEERGGGGVGGGG